MFSNDSMEQMIANSSKISEILQQLIDLKSRNANELEINSVLKTTINEHIATVKMLFEQIYNTLLETTKNINQIEEQEADFKNHLNHYDESYQTAISQDNQQQNVLTRLQLMEMDALDQEANILNQEIELLKQDIQISIQKRDQVADEAVDIRYKLEAMQIKNERVLEEAHIKRQELGQQLREMHERQQANNVEMTKLTIESDTMANSIREFILEKVEFFKEVEQKYTEYDRRSQQNEKLLAKYRKEGDKADNDIQKLEQGLVEMDVPTPVIEIIEKTITENEICLNKIKEQKTFLPNELEDVRRKRDDLKLELQKLTIDDTEPAVIESELQEIVLNNEKISSELDELNVKNAETLKLLETNNIENAELQKQQQMRLESLNIEIENRQKDLEQLTVLTKDQMELQTNIKAIQEENQVKKTKLEAFKKEQFELGAQNDSLCGQCKAMDLEIEAMNHQISRLQMEKEFGSRKSPTPILKQEPKRGVLKRKGKKMTVPTPPLPKRAIYVESDSSVEGEKVTFQQFMVKKRQLDQNKKK